MSNTMSKFADTITCQKYLWTEKGEKSWNDICYRVVKNVMRSVGIKMNDQLAKDLLYLMTERIFIPGGRYLYSSGRPYHQTQNCLLLKAEDSREGWAELLHKSSMALMTGAGIGVVYSDIRAEGKYIRKTGGTSTGPIALMSMLNECGRGIMQGGSRRSAIWAGLHWNHNDIHKFIHIKDWSQEVRDLKTKDFNFPATLDGTNISVILDDDFFEAFNNDKHSQHSMSQNVYWETIRQMLKTAEPGFSIDIGKNNGENLRNAPVSGNTFVLLNTGYTKVKDIIDKEVTIWTGKQWVNTVFKKTGENVPVLKVKMSGDREIICDPDHEFISSNGKRIKAKNLRIETNLMVSLPNNLNVEQERLNSDYYTLGYVYGDGSFLYKRNAEATFCTEDSKKCIEGLSYSLISSITKKDKRGYSRVYFKANDIFKNRSKEIFPEDLYNKSFSEKAYFIAGLFDSDGNYFKPQNRIRLASKNKNFLIGVRRLLESMGILSGINKGGISTYGKKEGYLLVVNTEYLPRFKKFIPTIRLNINEYTSYRSAKIKVLSVEKFGNEDVFCCDVKVPEHSFMAEGIIISNCTEITSRDDSDICNLGSINMSRINTLEEMQKAVELGTYFLLAGTVYSDVPYSQVDKIRTKNRRLGLGLMGLHEWLLKRGKKYDIDSELEEYLKVYSKSTEYAHKKAKEWDLTKPIKTRAIAPTGSIGIIGETTTGIEPIFCVAYKRRYLKHTTWNYQYVIDPTAKRLIDQGVKPESIEDAYSIDLERRLKFQGWIQQYVDHAISSTINLPAWGSESNNENKVREYGDLIMKYLPQLRGLTTYPDGARGGQPLTPVSYNEAIKQVGEIFIENTDICDISKSGSCGS